MGESFECGILSDHTDKGEIIYLYSSNESFSEDVTLRCPRRKVAPFLCFFHDS